MVSAVAVLDWIIRGELSWSECEVYDAKDLISAVSALRFVPTDVSMLTS